MRKGDALKRQASTDGVPPPMTTQRTGISGAAVAANLSNLSQSDAGRVSVQTDAMQHQ